MWTETATSKPKKTLDILDIPCYTNSMDTQQQLIAALEHATFYGTWDDANKAQAALDKFIKENSNG